MSEGLGTVEYLDEFAREHELTPSDMVWLLDYSMPGYLPSSDNYWLFLVSDKPADVVGYALDAVRESYEHSYESEHAADCGYESLGECEYCSDMAYVDSLAADLIWLTERGGWHFKLDYPNNGWGEVWTLRQTTLAAIGYEGGE